VPKRLKFTGKMLIAAEACLRFRRRFAGKFGTQLILRSEEEAVRVALENLERFDWQWAAVNLLTYDGHNAYHDEHERIWDTPETREAEKKRDDAWDAYAEKRHADAELYEKYRVLEKALDLVSERASAEAFARTAWRMGLAYEP
jgi:hypothetical protein